MSLNTIGIYDDIYAYTITSNTNNECIDNKDNKITDSTNECIDIDDNYLYIIILYNYY